MIIKRWIAYGILVVVATLSACSSAKKKTQTVTPPPPMISSTPAMESPTVADQDTVEKDTVAILTHGGVITNPQSSIFQQLLTPEQKAEELYISGVQRNYGFSPTVHYDLRKPQFVMIHHTSQNSMAQTIRTFQLEHTKVSAHYVIGRDGQVVQMLNDYMRAWHAGAGKWGNIIDMNSVSIGIELDNNGHEPFPDAQINALLILLNNLKSRHRIPQLNFIGHSDFAPGRKDDPSTYFPWEVLAERGFGVWYDANYLVSPPPTFNSRDALKIIGYDTSNLRTAVRAFKKKFIRTDLSSELTPYDIMVLYDLYRKFYQ